MSGFSIPLSSLERQARTHGILCAVGFLILLPIGVLVARLTRTFTNKWFWGHWVIQFLISAPVILVGWAMGHKTTTMLGTPHFFDTHQKIGLALLIMYLVQLFFGAFTHFFKFPSLFRNHRPPHSYFHAILGLAIIALAAYQVHYALYIEWIFATGGTHQVPASAKHAWLALIIVFWVLYAGGLALLPRQYSNERQARKGNNKNHIPLNSNNGSTNGV